jgi:hypothetical protein
MPYMLYFIYHTKGRALEEVCEENGVFGASESPNSIINYIKEERQVGHEARIGTRTDTVSTENKKY